VPADEKLVPAPPARVAGHMAAEFFARGTRHDLTVLVGARCVAQWLMGQIAAVPYQLTEERDTLIWPAVGGERLRDCSRQCETVAQAKLGDRRPSTPGEEPVLRSRAERPPAGQPHREDRSRANTPDAFRLRRDDLPVGRHRENLGRDESLGGPPPAVGQEHRRLASDALTKIGELRLEIARLPRLDGA